MPNFHQSQPHGTLYTLCCSLNHPHSLNLKVILSKSTSFFPLLLPLNYLLAAQIQFLLLEQGAFCLSSGPSCALPPMSDFFSCVWRQSFCYLVLFLTVALLSGRVLVLYVACCIFPEGTNQALIRSTSVKAGVCEDPTGLVFSWRN